MYSIDILIPTYNRDFLLNNVVENILKQSYDNLNVIISDNCSTDNTRKVGSFLSQKYNNVYYYRNIQNLGIYGNYNCALGNYCKSDYVLILSDDDFFIDFDYIKNAMEYIEKENLAWIAAGYYTVNTFTNQMKTFCRKEKFIGNGKEFLKIHKFGLDNFAWFTVIFNRKEALKFKFNEALHNSDYLTIFSIGFDKKVAILNKVVGIYTLNNVQSNYNVDQNRVMNSYKIYEILKYVYQDKYDEAILIENIKDCISAYFKFLMDKDALYNLVDFDDKFWIEYFRNLYNGRHFPFFDEETAKRYNMYITNKDKFKEIRFKQIEQEWNEIKNEFIMNYIRIFHETNT